MTDSEQPVWEDNGRLGSVSGSFLLTLTLVCLSSGKKALVTFTTPNKFTSMTWRKVAVEIQSTAPELPILVSRRAQSGSWSRYAGS